MARGSCDKKVPLAALKGDGGGGGQFIGILAGVGGLLNMWGFVELNMNGQS